MTLAAQRATIRLPQPHTGQRIVREQLRRYNFLCCGRRWRKTTLAMAVMVEQALAQTAEYVWAAPTYKQARRGWTEMQRACEPVVQFHESRFETHFPNGSVVYFLSLEEHDNKRGYTSFGTVIDEASEVSAIAYQTVMRPMLSDTGGWLLAFGTPKGRNWFYSEVQRALHGEDANSMAWVAPTLGATLSGDGELLRTRHPLENPEFSWDEMQHEHATLPERVFRQEYLAEFLDDAGGVFRNVESCVGGALEEQPPNTVYQYVIGIDLAKHLDYTVLCVGDLREQRVVAFDRFNKADWPLQKARIIEAARRWNNALVWMDSTGVGDAIYDDLYTAGLRIHPYKFSNASKEQLINNAVLMVEQRAVSFPRIPVLIEELKALQYTQLPSGALRIAAPEGLHDDAAMAFALMCWPLGHGYGATVLSTQALDALRGAAISDIGGVRLLGRTF